MTGSETQISVPTRYPDLFRLLGTDDVRCGTLIGRYFRIGIVRHLLLGSVIRIRFTDIGRTETHVKPKLTYII